MSLEDLKAKLEAAESRRVSQENKLKERMSREGVKAEKIQEQLASTDGTNDELKSKVDDKEAKALENREASLKALRDKRKAKEEHARKVREAKRLSSQLSPNSSAAAL